MSSVLYCAIIIINNSIIKRMWNEFLFFLEQTNALPNMGGLKRSGQCTRDSASCGM